MNPENFFPVPDGEFDLTLVDADGKERHFPRAFINGLTMEFGKNGKATVRLKIKALAPRGRSA